MNPQATEQWQKQSAPAPRGAGRPISGAGAKNAEGSICPGNATRKGQWAHSRQPKDGRGLFGQGTKPKSPGAGFVAGLCARRPCLGGMGVGGGKETGAGTEPAARSAGRRQVES